LRNKIKKLAALLVVMVLWQGVVRRQTPAAHGDSLLGAGNSEKPTAGDILHCATFNMAGGVSPVDNRLDLNRTAKYLRGFDLIGLEEVHDDGIFDRRDQAELLGELLHRAWLWAPAENRWWRPCFGDAVLSDLASTHWDRWPLAMQLASTNRELLEVAARWHGHDLTVLITHLDRHIDHDMELGAVLAAFRDAPLPAILLADLNTIPADKQLVALRADPTVTDCLGQFVGDKIPDSNVDWIFARGLKCTGAGFTDNDASDHKLVWADLTEGMKP
jgi:endonuclease/exonuclease/phosphatase family metal-dependent hydrolase